MHTSFESVKNNNSVIKFFWIRREVMNTNKRYDATKQNKQIKHSEKSATFEALKNAEKNIDITKTSKS